MRRVISLLLAALIAAACFAGCGENVTQELSVNADNVKRWYLPGEKLDLTGLSVKVLSSDGTAEEVSLDECNITVPSLDNAGEAVVKLTYRGLETAFTVNICTVEAEEEGYTAYRIRENEKGIPVILAASVVEKGKPFVLILPGGAYADARYAGKEGYSYAKLVNELGYNAFILKYSTLMKHPDPLEDVNRALELISENCSYFGVTMDDYAVCGSSAGGHLAASWCLKRVGYGNYGKPRPAAVILAYPVINFITGGDASTKRNLLGREPDPEMERALSVDLNVDSDYPPTFMWVFREDPLCSDTEAMEVALKDAGVTVCVHYYTGGEHGMGLAEDTEAKGWLNEAVAFWSFQMK